MIINCSELSDDVVWALLLLWSGGCVGWSASTLTDISVTGVKMGSQRKIDDVGMIMCTIVVSHSCWPWSLVDSCICHITQQVTDHSCHSNIMDAVDQATMSPSLTELHPAKHHVSSTPPHHFHSFFLFIKIATMYNCIYLILLSRALIWDYWWNANTYKSERFEQRFGWNISLQIGGW